MLTAEIISEITHSAPISVARFMDLCLTHPVYGYYKTQNPLGKDFITSPEISQIFGESVGIWAALHYEKMGSPAQFSLVEMGAGRGTLILDVLRVMKRYQPEIHIVEINPVLIATQKQTLQNYSVTWHENLDTLPKQPTIFFSNELFDCLPVHQFEKINGKWHERLVGVRDENLIFGLSSANLPPAYSDGLDFKEVCFGVKVLLQQLKTLPHLSALFIDYGYETGGKDTLQAMKNGAFVNPLEQCGLVDLTAHVDFGALKRETLQLNFNASEIKTQRDFLLEYGAVERLYQLIDLNPIKAESLINGFNRITDNASQTSMGLLFKTLEITS